MDWGRGAVNMLAYDGIYQENRHLGHVQLGKRLTTILSLNNIPQIDSTTYNRIGNF
jgi:hypothetical protein